MHIFQETLSFLTAEFKDNITVVSSDGSLVPRTMSWSGLRYMLSEVTHPQLSPDNLRLSQPTSALKSAIKFSLLLLQWSHVAPIKECRAVRVAHSSHAFLNYFKSSMFTIIVLCIYTYVCPYCD